MSKQEKNKASGTDIARLLEENSRKLQDEINAKGKVKKTIEPDLLKPQDALEKPENLKSIIKKEITVEVGDNSTVGAGVVYGDVHVHIINFICPNGCNKK